MQKGKIIKKLRQEKNISQRKMAEILNLSLSMYKLYEGEIIPIPLSKLNEISNYFNASLDYLTGLSKIKKTSNLNSNINYYHLSLNLKIIRKRNKLTQKELAKILNVSTRSIARYETNSQNIPINFLYNYAKLFCISLDYLCKKY